MVTRAKQGYRLPITFQVEEAISPVPKSFQVLTLIRFGAPPWKKNMLLCKQIAFGILCLILLVPMLSQENGSSVTSLMLRGTSIGTRLGSLGSSGLHPTASCRL